MEGDFFHLVNRGIEKRKIFLEEKDYLRFVYNLYDFNDEENVTFSYWNRRKFSDVRHPNRNERKEIVDILSWCLMPNHPHVFVQEKVDGGISLFSQKIIGGYTKYFNEANQREGVLFQGGTKIIKINRDSHLIHLPFYIMANPLDLIEPKWREEGIRNLKRAIEFLENYEYSSLHDLIGKINFPFTINKALFYKLFDNNEKQFREDFIKWLEAHHYKEFNFKKFEI